MKNISIHSPRVGRGLYLLQAKLAVAGISIHSPRVGRGHSMGFPKRTARIFQSTRPGWGEAKCTGVKQNVRPISIHSPRVGRGSVRGFPCAPL